MDNSILGFIFSFVFGAIIGSFLNVLILRLPKDQSMGGHSHCPHCKHQLHAFDLVPIVSYIFLEGKCRYCRKPISHRYILIETATAILFALNFFVLNSTNSVTALNLIRFDFIAACLVVIFTIDLEHSLILDKFIFPSTVILFVLNLFVDLQNKVPLLASSTLGGLLSGLGVFLFFGGLYYFSKGKWMGFGDVKFSFFLGLATPFPAIIMTLFLSFMTGSVVGLGLLFANVKKLKSQVPFGTFLAVSCIISLYFGAQLIAWYFRLIGYRP